MMGNQTRIQFKSKKTERKCILYLLWSVTSFSLTASAANIYETSPAHRNTSLKLGDSSAIEGTGSTNSAAQPHPRPPLVVSQSVSPQQSDEPRVQSDFAALPDVSVTCGRSDFVVRVKPSFYGLGADASELKLGDTCKSNGVLRPYGDLLFTYPLTQCDVQRELLHGYLVYKFVLHYDPSPDRFPSKAHPVSVDIECRFQRNHYLHQLAIQPTWETVIAHKRLKTSQTNFRIQLMDDSWDNPVKSRVFQLGKTVNFHVSALQLPPGRKIYINSCYATPMSQSKSHIKFTIIDNYGCLVDSKTDPGASEFISRTDKSLRFSMKAFQFITDPDAEISMHCQLYVTSAGPRPAHKSCTYRHNRWEALSGDDTICKCCESQCVASKPQRAMMDGTNRSLWVSSHLHTSNSMVSSMDKKEKEKITKKPKTKHLEENADLTEMIKHEQGRSEVKDSNQSKEEHARRIYNPEEHKVKGDERKENLLDLKQANYTVCPQDQRLKPEAVLKEGDAQPLDSEGVKEKQKCADGNVKEEIKEVLDQSWKNSDGNVDVMDEKDSTWYFTWR